MAALREALPDGVEREYRGTAEELAAFALERRATRVT
jgi:hypothetical protein